MSSADEASSLWNHWFYVPGNSGHTLDNYHALTNFKSVEEHRCKDAFNRFNSIILQTHTLVDASRTPDRTLAVPQIQMLVWTNFCDFKRKTNNGGQWVPSAGCPFWQKKWNKEYGWKGHTVKVMLPSLLLLTAYCRTSISGSPTLNHVYQTCLKCTIPDQLQLDQVQYNNLIDVKH